MEKANGNSFQREPVTMAFIEEAMPLFTKHFDEISANKDIPLDIDYEKYLGAEAAGSVRNFTARDQDGKLIGYAVFFIYQNFRYKSSLQAQQDVLYIDPSKRGFGFKFIDWCDKCLRLEQVQVVYHHTKAKPELNFGPMLERRGYKLVDLIYAKRLDLEV